MPLALGSSLPLLALALFAPEGESEPAAGEPTLSASDDDAAEAPAPARATASASPGSTIDPFNAWKLRLSAAVDATNEDPAAGVDELRGALAEAPKFTVELASDDAARSERNEGNLSLSRALLTLGDAEAAATAMDSALRDAGNDPLSPQRFGPSLADLHRQRLAALDAQGRGTIRVECALPCRVFINEHPAPAHAGGLFLGRYRVRIEASSGGEAPYTADLELGPDAREVRLPFPAQAAEGPADANLPIDAPTAGKRGKKGRRALPRWLEITSIVGGAAAVGAGVFLLRMDDYCVGDLSFKPSASMPGTCKDIYNTRIGAFTAIGAGAFFFAGGVITLSIDESRARRSRASEAAPDSRTVMLGYTRRF
ncbi:MAG: hypothetical protein H6710_21465 [Myxococcales bacterium]|nr:hypothetical protein [Myxococcales bacterium]MCB9701704.1 hypothetical protein [Myxococcales bacterium]